MNDRFDDQDLPPTFFEIEQRRHDEVNKQNARRERMRLRRDNAAAGHDEPKHGDVLHVQLDGGVTVKRNRAGIRFERGQRHQIKVVDRPDSEVAAMQRSGASVVTIEGAERILEDSSLHVFNSPADMDTLSELQSVKSQLEEELRVTRAENAELAAAMRAARQSAKDPGDGSPARLQAAAAAKVAAAGKPKPAAPESEFGTSGPETK